MNARYNEDDYGPLDLGLNPRAQIRELYRRDRPKKVVKPKTGEDSPTKAGSRETAKLEWR